MEQGLVIPLISLGVGALLGGVVQAAVGRYAAFKESQGVARALRAEINAIIEIVEHRQYIQHLNQLIPVLNNPALQVSHQHIFNVRVGQDYLVVFKSLGHKIGLLGAHSDIIGRFYTQARSILEDLHTLSALHDQALRGQVQLVRTEILSYTQNLRDLFVLALANGRKAVSELDNYENQNWLLNR